MSPQTIVDEYINQDVEALSFEGEHFETKFTGSKFTAISMHNCRLDRVLMAKTHWKNCDFKGSTFVAHFNDAVFDNCNFEDVAFKGLSGQYGGLRARFNNCNFRGAKFIHVLLRASHFVECEIDPIQFIRCDLRGTKINGNPIIRDS